MKIPAQFSAPRPRPLNGKDEEWLKLLASQDLLRSSEGSNSADGFDRKMSAFEARRCLEMGQPVAIAHPHLGQFEKARYPENPSKWYLGNNVDPAVREHAQQVLQRDHVVHEEALISDSQQLNRLLQANGFSQSTPDLSAEEAEAAAVLRKVQGGLHGAVVAVLCDDDFSDGYYFHSKPDPSNNKDGIYNPQVKRGGFLGWGGHHERLTPYEAIELLSNQQPIQIVQHGRRVNLHSYLDLKDFQRLE